MRNALDPYIRECLNDKKKFQFNALDKAILLDRSKECGLPEERIINAWNIFENTIWSEAEFIAELKPNVPKIDELFRLWKGTPLQNLELTSVGMAIGHANAVRVTGFDADLSIWIK
jgi:hypothetical protein